MIAPWLQLGTPCEQTLYMSANAHGPWLDVCTLLGAQRRHKLANTHLDMLETRQQQVHICTWVSNLPQLVCTRWQLMLVLERPVRAAGNRDSMLTDFSTVAQPKKGSKTQSQAERQRPGAHHQHASSHTCDACRGKGARHYSAILPLWRLSRRSST